jgi:hydrogenase maturation protein HypF
MLHKQVKIENWLEQKRQHFPHGEKEIQMLFHQLEKGSNTVETTSCGRVLDAVAAILDICYERTYEGEPAMKLESAATKGRDVMKPEPKIRGDILDTTQMILKIFENRQKHSKENMAYFAHLYLARGLATLAIEKALENDVKTLGFSGGVACNEVLALAIRKIVEASGLKFLVHEATTPGDGGLSLGQAFAAGYTRTP